MDKSAGIFLLIVFAAGAGLVAFAMHKNRDKYGQLKEFCSLRGWSYSAPGADQAIPFTISGKVGTDWTLEAHIASGSGKTGSRESASSYRWKSPRASSLKGCIVVAVRIPIFATLMADSVTPDPLKGKLKEVDTGIPSLIALASEGSDTILSKPLLEALRGSMENRDSGFLALRLDQEGLLVKLPFTTQGAQVVRVVEFCESLIALLKN